MRLPVLCIVTFPAFLIFSCSHPSIIERYGTGAYLLQGTMHFDKSLEGGCWFLLAADSISYQPVGDKSADLRKDGLKVHLIVADARDIKTFCMSGKLVEVLDILQVQTPQ